MFIRNMHTLGDQIMNLKSLEEQNVTWVPLFNLQEEEEEQKKLSENR